MGEAREKSCVHGAIGFGFDSHWLKNRCESFKSITKRSIRNHLITFDSHLKTTLLTLFSCLLSGAPMEWTVISQNGKCQSANPWR